MEDGWMDGWIDDNWKQKYLFITHTVVRVLCENVPSALLWFQQTAAALPCAPSIMSTNPACTVFVGNLDERVTDRVLYDILIQAGRLVDLYIPRDRETDRPKGFAFAEYETEEIADYAVRLFSGLVTLYNRTLRFAISGQDKPSINVPPASAHASNLAFKSRNNITPSNDVEVSPSGRLLSTSCRFSEYQLNYARVSVTPSVLPHSNGFRPHVEGNNDYRRDSRASWDNNARSRSSRFDTGNPISYGQY